MTKYRALWPSFRLRFAGLIFVLVSLSTTAHADHLVALPALPPEVASNHFTVTVNGLPTPVVHAAANYYLLSFPIAKKPLTITVTAETDDFWKRGVEVQPWRLGIRPTVQGRTITFQLRGRAQISITRPHDFLADAEMLFLFADPVETDAPAPTAAGVRYFGPGVHKENIDAHDGDRIYLAPGAFVFGSLNVWGTHDVRVWGRGTIIYDGPQNPADDDGWMHKPNWHCIVMDNARNVSVEGLTCIVRSRTWMIQMKDSEGIHYSNIKVIGGSNGNANQDGMDWLGGGDTVVEDSFFRAADDVFAMQGNWEGYDPALLSIPGHDVRNIQIRRSTLSTSISNVVRAAWPGKTFNTANFSLTDSDVLHAGIGGCKVPFSLLEIWDDPDGHGNHTDYQLKNVRLEDWYSLLQLRHPSPSLKDVHLDGIFALEQPSLVPSTLSGEVSGVSITNANLAGTPVRDASGIPFEVQGAATAPTISPGDASFDFTIRGGPVHVGDKVHFTANPLSGQGAGTYEWLFGDGTTGRGRTPKHRYRDADGTLNDGSGRFRVLLHTTTSSGEESWIAHPVMVVKALEPASTVPTSEPGLLVSTNALETSGTGPAPSLSQPGKAVTTLNSEARPGPENYALHFAGLVQVPADDGYTFLLAANDFASLKIDGKLIVSSPKPWPQVCGLAGNAVQTSTGTIGLSTGLHKIEVKTTHSVGDDNFALYWQANGQPFHPIPPSALRHVPAPLDEGKP